MAKAVTDEYAELFHYTTAEGLHGIISGQYLRATNIAFLNDSEERVRYLDRRMPLVIKQAVQHAISDLMNDPKALAIIEREGGCEKVIRELSAQLKTEIPKTTMLIDEPYVTSFCGTHDPRIARDGLLSQWRAYGEDGGYAIVFDAKGLEELLIQENARHHYLTIRWGDINYHDESTDATVLDEVRENEKTIYESLVSFVKNANHEELGPIYDPISSLSCLTKHWGFHEEREVRVVATVGTETFVKQARELGEVRPDKVIHHFSRGGVLIPYVRLFEGLTSGQGKGLPIKSIIVGPHPDKIKRRKSVETLLRQHGIQAEVTVSDIPYISR